MDKIRFLNSRTRTTDSESHINNHIINYLNINGLIILKKKKNRVKPDFQRQRNHLWQVFALIGKMILYRRIF